MFLFVTAVFILAGRSQGLKSMHGGCCCRLLDDNRQLFVPELQETINPHPHFMLFATQNPPGTPLTQHSLVGPFCALANSLQNTSCMPPAVIHTFLVLK